MVVNEYKGLNMDRRKDPNREKAIKNGELTFIASTKPCRFCGGFEKYTNLSPFYKKQSNNCTLCSYKKQQSMIYHKFGGNIKSRDTHLKKSYNLSLISFNEIFKKQNYKCAICGTETNQAKNKSFHVDHCHKEKKVRGILCNKCNTGIGFLNHDVNVLQNAINYLNFSNNLGKTLNCEWENAKRI